MRIACIDDHRDDINAAKKIIDKFEDIKADYFYDTTSIVENCQMYDAILMDIDVPIDNGLITAKKLREKEYDRPIVFMSWHFGFEHESFAVHPFCFIKKENLEYEMSNCIYDLLREYLKGNETFQYNDNQTIKNIRTRDILYFKRVKNGIEMYIKQGFVIPIRCSLEVVEYQKLHDFHKIDQSVIVNFYQVEEYINKNRIKMKNEHILYVSRRRQKDIYNEYLSYITR